MLGTWKEAKDNNKAFGALLTDLSKAFDSLSHDLLIAKLARIASYIGIRKRRTLKNAFFKSQLNYYPLIWMCCNRSLNNKIDRLHEQSLRIVYSDKTSDLGELLEKIWFCLYSLLKHPTTCKWNVQGIKRFMS